VKITTLIQTLYPRTVFRISREAQAQTRNVIIAIRDGDYVGYGEASPSAFYRESAEHVQKLIAGIETKVAATSVSSVDDVRRLWETLWPNLQPSRAAQCAVDLALWDLAAKKAGRSVTELALGGKPHPVLSSFTIGLSTPEELPQKVADVKSLPVIKLKMDATANLDPLRYILSHTKAKVRVDANCAWGDVDIGALSRQLADLGVEFIEQPLPPDQHDRMPELLKRSALPILADESCVELEHVERVPGHFSGFNIKLVKCGGLTPALRMLERGKALGLKMMVGCMLETNLLISAGAVVAQQTDYADLDGSWLLRKNPFDGVNCDRGYVCLADAPGLGVTPRDGFLMEV
jgi:L-Ala-D/L-Glu epimerase